MIFIWKESIKKRDAKISTYIFSHFATQNQNGHCTYYALFSVIFYDFTNFLFQVPQQRRSSLFLKSFSILHFFTFLKIDNWYFLCTWDLGPVKTYRISPSRAHRVDFLYKISKKKSLKKFKTAGLDWKIHDSKKYFYIVDFISSLLIFLF